MTTEVVKKGRSKNIYNRENGGVVNIPLPVEVTGEQAQTFERAGMPTGSMVAQQIVERDLVSLKRNPVTQLYDALKSNPAAFKRTMELNEARNKAADVLENLQSLLLQQTDGDTEKSGAIETQMRGMQDQLNDLG